MKPVLIAGAGPVGMTLAAELARYGILVRIVDKAPARTDKSKALVLWSRTLELLERGPGGAMPFIAAGFKAHAVNMVAGAKLIARVTMDDVASPYNFGLMIPQSETERLLEERLLGLGVGVERGSELAGFTPRPDGVEATLRHPDGRLEILPVDWLIGCDGAHSLVRHTVGAAFSGETMLSDWILADVHMRNYPWPDTESSIYWHRDGVFVIFPISPGRYRVLADLPPSGQAQPPAPSLAEVQALIDRRGPPGLIASDPVWLSGFRINGRKVTQYRHGRVFLAGDAAHVHSPAGGQGMNTGMQDAFNLAWKLALVIQGHAVETLLDSYSAERSEIGDEVLKTAGRLTAIGTMKNPLGQGVRNFVGHLILGLSPVRHKVADTITEISIGYAQSPLNGPELEGVHPRPGDRIPPRPGIRPPGAGAAPLFALHAEAAPAVIALTRQFPHLLDAAIRPVIHPNTIYLARPDGYCACACHDPADIAAYLARLTPA